MNFKKIPPKKSRIIMILFLASGAAGIFVGLSNNILMYSTMGVINLCLGGLFGWVYLTQEPQQDKRKKKRKD